MSFRLMRWTLALLVLAAAAPAQPAADLEWPTYGGDLASTRYSPADLITADNFADLELAWTLSTDNLGPEPEYNLQSTPLMIGGVLYTTAGTGGRSCGPMPPRRAAVDAPLSTRARGRGGAAALSGRGHLAYRDDGGGRDSSTSPGLQPRRPRAATGRRLPGFGTGGIVDLKLTLDQDIDPVTGEVGLHAAPIVAGDTIVVGAAHLPGGRPRSMQNVKGHIRGFDARTGERKWIFHTVPGADEFGNDTWLGDSWRYTGNTGVWGQMTVDAELGIAYFATEMPTNDYYGGHRHGDNLFSDSLVAVDLETGERLWHFQFIHHDVWDWDLPCAPILVDITVDGREIKAVAQPSKQTWLYVFDRVTGEPVWPIEERPVEASNVPGELLALTQPFPTKPPAYDRQGVGIDDLVDFTPELRAEAERIASNYRMGPIFTPPTVSVPEGPWGTLMLPSQAGGTNWPGASYDPETGIMYLYSYTQVVSLGLVNDPEQSDMNFIRGRAPEIPAAEASLTIEGIPIIKPPWGRITAIDLNQGEILWQVPHGETPDNIRNHPRLEGVDIPRTGRVGRIGTLNTKTLVIAGEGGMFTTPSGEPGAMLRAYDKMTGEEVGEVYMPAPQSGSPMTYVLDGVQYIVVATSGSGQPGRLLAYRLPPD